MANSHSTPLNGRFQDLTGLVVGRLTVVSFGGIGKAHQSLWNCLCECGTKTVKYGYDLKRPYRYPRACGRCSVSRAAEITDPRHRERILRSIVVTSDGCWEWNRRRDKDGYGQLTIKGRPYGAHVVSYVIHAGDVPPNMFVLHKCDNPPCCNPEHLFLGTHDDNVRDRDSKGRQAHGEGHGRAKLTADDVRQIRQLRSTERRTFKSLSEQFGVSTALISNIVNGHLWRCVPDLDG